MMPNEEGPAPAVLRRRLFGRRTGPKLRPRRQDLLAEGLSRLKVALPEGEAAVEPSALFAAPKRRFELEIGCGGGEHLAAQAQAAPDTGFIGCEPYLAGMASLLRHIDEAGLENIRVLADDARLLLARLPPGSLSRIFLLFPDPWPKTRHHKRRFVQRDTLDLLAAALADGGELRVASDIMAYVEWTLARILDHPAFEWTAQGPDDWRRRPDDWPQTRYEQKAVAAGRRPAYLSFRRRARG